MPHGTVSWLVHGPSLATLQEVRHPAPPWLVVHSPGLAALQELRDAGVHERVRDGNIRMLNVRQPWATMLVLGCKTIENRAITTMSKPADGEWVLIVASKAPPTAALLHDLREDCVRAWGAEGEFRFQLFRDYYARSFWPTQAIVGLVRFSNVDPPETPGLASAPWYQDGCAAWRVDRHFAFEQVIQDVPGTLSLRRLSTPRSRQDGTMSRIQAALQHVLDADADATDGTAGHDAVE